MYKKIAISSFLLLFIVYLYSCDDNPVTPPENFWKVTIKQGVWGNVWFWQGNFMPGSASGTITPVIREIYIYDATKYDSVQRILERPGFVKEIQSNFVKKVVSDNDGFYQVSLAPGKYSFFVKEDSLFYAPEIDSAGYFMSATVKENSVVKRQINIDYNAAY